MGSPELYKGGETGARIAKSEIRKLKFKTGNGDDEFLNHQNSPKAPNFGAFLRGFGGFWCDFLHVLLTFDSRMAQKWLNFDRFDSNLTPI
jgi:hypothetical protein